MNRSIGPVAVRLIDAPEAMRAVEALQRIVWPGSDVDVVPAHLLLTAAHNGGLVAGAYVEGRLAGFAFGFLGWDATSRPPHLKHCSHQLGVHPDYRNLGLGFALKRFQWQFVRAQGLDRVTWTCDPLLARNAQLNIAKLGAVCNIYLRDVYGELRDGLNAGLPTDRFQVDWWVNSERVLALMRDEPVPRRRLADYLDVGAAWINPPPPFGASTPPGEPSSWREGEGSDLLLKIPDDFLALKASDPALALTWRLRTRMAFEALFARGYAVTDFVEGAVYVLSKPRPSPKEQP